MIAVRRHPALAVLSALLVAAALGAAACGGDGDEPGDDRAAAEAAAREYMDAFLAGDGERACGLLTDEVREEFERAAGVEQCAPAFEQAAQSLDDQQRQLIRSAEVVIEEAEGDTATGGFRLGGQVVSPVEMRRVDGRWLVATGPG